MRTTASIKLITNTKLICAIVQIIRLVLEKRQGKMWGIEGMLPSEWIRV